MISGVVFWILPGMYWWIYLLIALLVGSSFYSSLLDSAAKEKIIDGE